MKHKHMFSLLDQSFTTVRVLFGTGYLKPLEPGSYDVTIESVQIETPLPTPWAGDDQPQSKAKMRTRMRHAQDLRNKSYVYKVPKAWNVKEGEHLVVLDPGGDLAVVNVIHVDEAPDIDVDADYDYKWAVSKVDTAEYLELNRREKEFGSSMLEIERVKQREQLLESFRNSLPEGSEARRLFEQTTASLSGPSPIDVSGTSQAPKQ